MYRWIAVVLSWGVCAGIIYLAERQAGKSEPVQSVIGERVSGEGAGGTDVSVVESSDGELRGVSFTRYDSGHGSRPMVTAGFARMTVENGSAGVFRTALHKEVTLEGFAGKFYEYSESPKSVANLIEEIRPMIAGARAKMRSQGSLTGTTAAAGESVAGEKPTEAADGFAVRAALPDVSNTTSVRFEDFEVQKYFDLQCRLTVRSIRGRIGAGEPGTVQLRGHVTLVDGSGTTLEANHVKWDIERQQFVVEGTYTIIRHGKRTGGSGLRLNEQLEPVETATKPTQTGDKNRCSRSM